MSQADRKKWDRRYREGAYLERVRPAELLVEWLPRLRHGTALDLACGAGRNALFLAQSGFCVDAMDISPVALERARASADALGVSVNWIHADLDSDPLPTQDYDLIVMMRYVNHALAPRLASRLAQGGYFVCEQHLVRTEDVTGPSSPRFRFKRGELRKYAQDLEICYYEEGLVDDADGRQAALARLVARRSPG